MIPKSGPVSRELEYTCRWKIAKKILIPSSNDDRLSNITIHERFALGMHFTICQRLPKQQILLLDPDEPVPFVRHVSFHDVLEALAQCRSAGSDLVTVDKLVVCGLSSDGLDGQERSGRTHGDDFGEGRAFGPFDLIGHRGRLVDAKARYQA